MKIGDVITVDPQTEDSNPLVVRGAYHTWMTSYLWRPSHPWAAVTDEHGRFEIRHVPVLEDDPRPILWVWHELLPGGAARKLGPIPTAEEASRPLEVWLPGESGDRVR